MPLKIVHLSSVHKPLDVRILLKECRTLAAEGHNVCFVVPHDRDETIDGVRICAVPRPSGRGSRFIRTVWQVYIRALQECGDVYHFHDPELMPVGLLLKMRGRVVVYDVHEDLPRQVLSKPWLPLWTRNAVSVLMAMVERVVAHAVDGIVAATPTIAKRFPVGKTVTVKNFPLLEEFPLAKGDAAPRRESASIVAYVGGVTVVRGVKEMVRALAYLPEHMNVKLALAGSFGPPELLDEVRCLPGFGRVSVLGWQSRAQVMELLDSAIAGLVTLLPTPNHKEALPIKLFEYMAAGLPVIASDFPLWRNIVEECECGLLVDPADPQQIAEAIAWVVENPQEAHHMGRRGRLAVLNSYNWDVEKVKILQLYSRWDSQ